MIRIIQKGEFMKKIKLFFCACFIFSLCFSLTSCQFVSEYEVHSFDMNEYQENLEIHRLREEFKDIEVCGKIKSGNDAVSKAKNVFDVVYGKFATGTQGPYDVYYDETRDAWLVTGTMLFSRGGGAPVIFTGEDGSVIAVWNYKL